MAAEREVFLKEIQKKFEEKLREHEISLLEYWKEQLDRLSSMKPEGIAALQLEIKGISDMMANRIKVLKRRKE